jgi:glucose/arabinose dehydrogenase
MMHLSIYIFSLSIFLGGACTPNEANQDSVSKQNTDATPSQRSPLAANKIELRPFAVGFDKPIFLTHANDGSGRLYVVEQTGRIRLLANNGSASQNVFIDLSHKLKSSRGEMGLLGLAFHPKYKTNGFFFVNYTSIDMKDTVARYSAFPDKTKGNPSSEAMILAIPDPASNHNGGMLAFGPDGYLYIGTGDGGGRDDTFKTSRDPSSLLAKMLRIDVDKSAPYAIPQSNPFRTNKMYQPEIWSIGLRNPWRYSFDRNTGDLYIADVGQNRIEEIHFQDKASRGGEDYGWNIMEGSQCFSPPKNCDQKGKNLPIAEYDHSLGCSVTGGYVYRGQRNRPLFGKYIFGDYCSGRIWALTRLENGTWNMDLLLSSGVQISSFGEDEEGELYVVGHGGTVYELAMAK